LLCVGVGLVGSLATAPAIEGWYAGLNKPSWRPPNWLFGPVWTTLYVMIGIAGWRIHRHGNMAAQRWWWTQLVFNAMWSPAFFGLKQPALALFIIVLMWVTIGGTIQRCWRDDRVSSILLTPYLAWVTFATALNLAIVMLN
jgi:benzodiazapine receptor